LLKNWWTLASSTKNPTPFPLSPPIDLALIFLAALFIYGWKLGVAPLAGTEPLRALVAHQMVQHGDLLVPHIYGELYLRKPPLQYWIVAATEWLAGHGNEFVWRLPSAIGSAILALFLAWWAGRWFGNRARLVTGFSCLALIALWAQDRGGDIDALNTLFSILTACCILELAVGPTQRRWMWCIALALSTGATLLLKGPAGLPTILGTLIGSALLVTGRRSLKKPAVWIGLLLGIAIFAVWLVAVYLRIHRGNLSADSSGAQEAGERLFLHSLPDAVWAILVPFRVLIYALPISIALPLSVHIALSLAPNSLLPDRILAIAFTVLISLTIGIIGGITNPRYSYVPMPLLAVLAGAVIAIAMDDETDQFLPVRKFIRTSLNFCCLLFLATILLMTGAAFSMIRLIDPREHASVASPELIAVAVASSLLCIWALRQPSISHRGWALAALIVLLGVPFAQWKNAERMRYSGRAIGMELRADLGTDPHISTAALVRDFPQVFYYADVSVETFGEHGLSKLAAAPGQRWIVLNDDEYAKLSKTASDRLSHITPLILARDTLYLAQYSNPSTTQPIK
jgi:4-amino-4-deoxy-L-arabinose transferase-like glycosyltransferase